MSIVEEELQSELSVADAFLATDSLLIGIAEPDYDISWNGKESNSAPLAIRASDGLVSWQAEPPSVQLCDDEIPAIGQSSDCEMELHLCGRDFAGETVTAPPAESAKHNLAGSKSDQMAAANGDLANKTGQQYGIDALGRAARDAALSRVTMLATGLLSCGLLGLGQGLSGVTLVHPALLLPLALGLLGFTVVGATKYSSRRAEISSCRRVRREPERQAMVFALGLLSCGLLGMAQHQSHVIFLHPLLLLPLSIVMLGFTLIATSRFASRS